ncbi:MAG TPA: hypothetical protein VFV54_05605, partial [Thermoanaerobaculia bacterium]|nr:hypothetical protein [Thermoanaerobaculia bacterium]
MTRHARSHASKTAPLLAGLLFFAANAIAQDDREAFQRALEERAAAEAQLEVLRREIPAEFEEALLIARLRGVAADAEIPN